MRAEDWERAEELFHRLAPLDDDGRKTALADLARTEPDLGGELASLLSAHDAEGVFDHLTAKLAPEPFGRQMATSALTGTKVAQYEIGPLIGQGGMGDVYRARDIRLGREVALKFLPDWLGRDPWAHDRILVEARIVSAIDHPNVCSLYELGETEDGRLFIVMPLYDGETLKHWLARKPLSPVETVEVALQVARGLEAAHERGIVHRDIKPANLLLTTDGRVKILDFGVAKLADVGLTRPGERPGTERYMAPEQAAGEAADERSDLWSLGAVMHEMLTGKVPPAASDSRDLDAAGFPPDLMGTIRALLAPEPENRYPDARSLARDLAVLADAPDALTVRRPTRRRWSMAAAGLAAGILLAIGAWLAPGASTDAPADPGVAVLPFRVTGNDLEYLREGVIDLMSINFDGAPGLRKIDVASTMTAWNDRVGENRAASSDEDALDVARSLGARYAVLGSVVQTGSRTVQLQAEAYDVRSGHSRGSAHVQGSPDSLTRLIDELTLELLRRGLVPADGGYASPNLARVTTSSLPALKAFLAGESAYREGDWPEAAAHYRESVDRDSLFARAWYRLGWSLFWSNRRHEEAFRRAAELAAGLPERDSLLLTAAALPQTERLEVLTRLTAAYPDDPDAWFMLGDGIVHAGGLLFRPAADYLVPLRRAVALAPFYEETSLHLFEDAFLRYDSARVDDLIRRTGARDSSTFPCPGFVLLRDMRWGSGASATRSAARFESVYEGPYPGCVWAAAAADSRALEIAERHELLFIKPGAPFVSPARFWRMVHARVTAGQLQRARELPDIAAHGGDDYVQQASQYAVALELAPYAADPVTTRRTVERLRSAPRSGELPHLTDFWLAIAAAEAERAGAFTEATLRIDSIAGAVGGTAASRIAAYERALEAFRDIRAGDFAAVDEFEAAMAQLDPDGWLTSAPTQYLRFHVGRTLLAESRFGEAERYFRSLYPYSWYFVPAQLELGRTYERLGERALARERYRIVAEAWATADPEFQPLVDEARSALARLR